MSESHRYRESESAFISELKSTLEEKGFSVEEEALFTDADGCEITVYGPVGWSVDDEPTENAEIGTISIVPTNSADPRDSITEINSDHGYENTLKEIADEASGTLKGSKPSEPGL